MIKKIIKKLNLEDNLKLISPIDEIKMTLKGHELCEILQEYKTNEPIEKYIQDLLCREESNVMDLLGDNYFNNILNSIHFIIGNPYSIDTKIFDIIHKNRNLIKIVPKNIIDNYKIILGEEKYDLITRTQQNNLHKYYNYEMISRWYKTVIPKKLKKSEYYNISILSKDKKEKKWEMYEEIIEIYNDACLELQQFIKHLLKFYKPLKHKVIGCSVFGKKYYEYCLESYLGIQLDPLKLEKWAYSELDKLCNQAKLHISIVIPNIKSSNNYKCYLDKMFKDESQKFKSKNELIEYYQKTINKYSKIFVEVLKFPEFEKPNLIIFDNPQLGGGYYYLNNFYLNVNSWKDMRKYSVESLVLHETMPGHHTQVHTMLNKKNKHSLILAYFGASCTGFIEGWGLFAERLGFEQTIWDKIGQLEYEIYRTLRIIVDIGLHYHGYTPDKMTKFMEDHLSMSRNEILNEIYRYLSQPGQAIAYKVGCQVFKKILEKQKIENVVEPKAIDLYKKLIIDGPKPLKFICKDYKLDVKNLFL
jgi:hypothetical protein